MPILQPSYGLWPADSGQDVEGDRRRSEKFSEGSWDLDGRGAAEDFPLYPTENRTRDLDLFNLCTSDREELIRYIKKGNESSWEGGYSAGNTTDCSSMSHASFLDLHMKGNSLRHNKCSERSGADEKEILGSPNIERPRSALHSGDFREGVSQMQARQSGRGEGSHLEYFSSSPTTPWFTPSFFSSLRSQEFPGHGRERVSTTGTRSRAPSIGSCSSSYVLKAPTSPLVYQANNTDLDFSPRTDLSDLSNSQEKANRRRTLPLGTFRSLDSPRSSSSRAIDFGAPPRSSASTYTLQLASSVQTPPSRTRRPSLASDMSSKPHAPMVGSYEESILRGRMSMSPSKPLNFAAQIGVLGRGKCKANLKCPPHVSIPFPAVFYSYPTSGNGRSISDDSPSPYVGLVDLENSLPKDDFDPTRRLRRHRSPSDNYGDPFIDTCTSNTNYNPHDVLRKREKRNRRAGSPKRPAGGCYRIPQQGQLQIVIKNPHKTAVKLFLVPYDLGDMEPGTKTFIRQRSYSAGPTLDMPLSARKNLGTDRPEASLNTTEDPKDKPVLRYLIHLNICCPSRGRYFLYSSIRVVFANRVPDGKESLRNEIQYPDPRYTPYKPSMSSSSRTKPVEKSCRRPSAGLGLTEGLMFSANESNKFPPYPSYPPRNTQEGVSPIPMQLPSASSAATVDERFLSVDSNADEYRNNSLEWALIPSHRLPSEQSDAHFADFGMYNKLSKGEAGYGGNRFGSSSGRSEAGESLLAQRLKGLDVQKPGAHANGRTNRD